MIDDPSSTPEQRAAASLVRARITFSRTGEILPVLDAAGAESPFQPSADEIELRRGLEEFYARKPLVTASLQRFQVVLASVALISSALGLLTPVRRAPRPAP